MLLNTSFNENEPIVENQFRAIKTFKRTSLDFLVINNNFLISKKMSNKFLITGAYGYIEKHLINF